MRLLIQSPSSSYEVHVIDDTNAPPELPAWVHEEINRQLADETGVMQSIVRELAVALAPLVERLERVERLVLERYGPESAFARQLADIRVEMDALEGVESAIGQLVTSRARALN